jgi:hypothetical protein
VRDNSFHDTACFGEIHIWLETWPPGSTQKRVNLSADALSARRLVVPGLATLPALGVVPGLATLPALGVAECRPVTWTVDRTVGGSVTVIEKRGTPRKGKCAGMRWAIWLN